MNSDIYTGADGAILLSSPGGIEGEAAQAVIDAHELVTVGRVQDVRIEVNSEVHTFHEIGQRYATQLRPGNVNITGSIGRAMINGAMLNLLLGEAAQARPGNNWVQPAFNMTVRVTNPASNASNTMTLHDIKLSNWSYQLPEDDFVIESTTFHALYITTEDA
ncbi:MAG: hypothetical protein D3925_16355 [Candidatus Electrothrix sp. AR5]|nr:hypothetical protein [Candidatus Electrothrix sp. AR5]